MTWPRTISMIWQFHPFLDGQTGRRHRRLAAVVADFPPRTAVAHALQALQLQPVKYRHLSLLRLRPSLQPGWEGEWTLSFSSACLLPLQAQPPPLVLTQALPRTTLCRNRLVFRAPTPCRRSQTRRLVLWTPLPLHAPRALLCRRRSSWPGRPPRECRPRLHRLL